MAIAVRPGEQLCPVVAREHDNRIVGNPEFVKLVKQFAHLRVELQHRVGERAVAALVLPFGREMGPDMTAVLVLQQRDHCPLRKSQE